MRTHRFWRVGTVIMLLHDANDVLMEAAKLAKYCRKEDLSVGFFASFTVAWLLLRLVCFPLLVIRSTLFEYPQVLNPPTLAYVGFNGCLCFLLCLHCWWFHLILKIVYAALKNGPGGASDIREDDDDDS